MMDNNPKFVGLFGIALIISVLGVLTFGMYTYKEFMESNNYDIGVAISGGCAGCGFAASLGGFLVGMTMILGVGVVMMIVLGIIAIISIVLIKFGLDLVCVGFGEEVANKVSGVTVILSIAVFGYLIGSLVSGEIAYTLGIPVQT